MVNNGSRLQSVQLAMFIKSMSINNKLSHYRHKSQRGVTLIELIVFLVVSAVILVALAAVFQQTVTSVTEPANKNQLLQLAQSQLERVLARNYDENSPPDGVPCGIGIPCAGIGLDSGEAQSNLLTLDDIDDFNGFNDQPLPGFQRRVTVAYAGDNFAIDHTMAKRITVEVTASSGEQVSLSTYRVNY